jgi:hypothetical protein
MSAVANRLGRLRKEPAMARWTVDAPRTLDLDDVATLRVRLISGSVAVLSTSERPCVDIGKLAGQPLLVSHEAGILTVTYEDLTWDGLLGWLRPAQHLAALTITVPRDCPTEVGVVNASAVVSGVAGRTSLKSVSGRITLDGVTGRVDADTLSGDLEAQGLDGRVAFKSVSGDLTVADGMVERLDARTVSGRVTADIGLASGAGVRVATLSGDVTIRLPASASAEVELRSTAGRVQSDFSGLQASRGPGTSSLTGALGTGSGRVSVTTMSGRITLLEGDDAAAAAGGPAPAGDAR